MKYIILIIGIFISVNTLAEPTGALTEVLTIRAFAEGNGGVFVKVSTSNYMCDTNEFKVDLSKSGGAEIYSMLLASMMSGKKVRLEIVSSGCTGWGTELRSVYIHK